MAAEATVTMALALAGVQASIPEMSRLWAGRWNFVVLSDSRPNVGRVPK